MIQPRDIVYKYDINLRKLLFKIPKDIRYHNLTTKTRGYDDIKPKNKTNEQDIFEDIF